MKCAAACGIFAFLIVRLLARELNLQSQPQQGILYCGLLPVVCFLNLFIISSNKLLQIDHFEPSHFW